MIEAFNRLNGKVEALLQENAKLMEHVKLSKGKDSSQKAPTGTQILAPSYPSQDKMDKKGLHSPTNAIRSTVSDDKDTASLVQTVASKDTSNSLMAVTLPKSEEESSSSRRRLPRSFMSRPESTPWTWPALKNHCWSPKRTLILDDYKRETNLSMQKLKTE
uniref:Uncharacterized protein n=1 Tax=Solanum tuberosum TaxID=4113 RepID=M1DK17_SOLTU